MQNEVNNYSQGLGIINDNYRSHKSVEELFGTNLLCVIFGSESPLNQDDSGSSNSRFNQTKPRQSSYQRQTSECFVHSESEEYDEGIDTINPNKNIKTIDHENKDWVNRQSMPPKFEADLNKNYKDKDANLVSRGSNYEIKEEYITESLIGITFLFIIKYKETNHNVLNKEWQFV